MVADPSYGLQQELRPKAPRWGPWSTLLWMALIAVVYTLAQLISDIGTAIARAATKYLEDKEKGPDSWPDLFGGLIMSLSERYRSKP